MEQVRKLRRPFVRTAEDTGIPKPHAQAQEEVNMSNRITKARAKTEAKARTARAARVSTFKAKELAWHLCKVNGPPPSGTSTSSSRRTLRHSHRKPRLLHRQCSRLFRPGEIKVPVNLG